MGLIATEDRILQHVQKYIKQYARHGKTPCLFILAVQLRL